MQIETVILIFDIGKTNKKAIVLNEDYKIVYEISSQFEEINDEDGFPCEDISALTTWLKDSLDRIISIPAFNVKAINVAAYGASFVYVDDSLSPILPLYNYLKPFPEELKRRFYEFYGGEEEFAKVTASPVLGSLNSGMQILRIKAEKPEIFNQVKWALHLPQYFSTALGGRISSEITSIGCHTNLWNFTENKYHHWVEAEGVDDKFPILTKASDCSTFIQSGKEICIGTGLHDSSAALIPYLASFHEPFLLISTGTWCISLNPFNSRPLTKKELDEDCLCYLTSQGEPIKAARLFAGYEHDQKVKRLAEYYQVSADHLTQIEFDPEALPKSNEINQIEPFGTQFSQSLDIFGNLAEAYHALMSHIVEKQIVSTKLIMGDNNVKQIFVDGGFSKNEIYMNLLASGFPDHEVLAASVPQASALGAAIAIHEHWNRKALPANLISLKRYSDFKKKTEAQRT